MKALCTTSKQRRGSRWEHEEVLEAVQRRLDENPQTMRRRRETVEHPFGTIKALMSATHFLMKRLKNVRTGMALSVLAYNLTRVTNIIGIRPLLQTMAAWNTLLAADSQLKDPLAPFDNPISSLWAQEPTNPKFCRKSEPPKLSHISEQAFSHSQVP